MYNYSDDYMDNFHTLLTSIATSRHLLVFTRLNVGVFNGTEHIPS
jgi:hypothetical protein